MAGQRWKAIFSKKEKEKKDVRCIGFRREKTAEGKKVALVIVSIKTVNNIYY